MASSIRSLNFGLFRERKTRVTKFSTKKNLNKVFSPKKIIFRTKKNALEQTKKMH